MMLYADVVRVALGDAARAALEALMQSPEKYEFQSEFAKKYTALGRAEGELKGRAEGEANALLRILARRGLQVGEEQRNRIPMCTDLAVLEKWLRGRAGDAVYRGGFIAHYLVPGDTTAALRIATVAVTAGAYVPLILRTRWPARRA